MLKSELITALEKIHGDPEVEVKIILTTYNTDAVLSAYIDRINEYPRPEIVVIEK